MKLVQLSTASIIACLLGLAGLTSVGLASIQHMRAVQRDVVELLELHRRIADFSVASDQLLLYPPHSSLWQAYRADAQALREQLLQMGTELPVARRTAHHVGRIVEMLDALRAQAQRPPAPAPDAGGAGPLEMPPRSRMIMTELANHGIAMDTTLDEVLRQREALIAREAIWIAAGFGGAALLFGAGCIIAFGLIHRRITGPARALEQTFLRLAAGDHKARVRVAGDDEFAQLARTFNSMLDQRRQTEERLHEYRALVEGSRDLYAVLDVDHRFLLMNRAYVDAYGLDPDTVVGQHMRDVFGNEFYEREVRQRLERALAGETVEFEAERDYRDRGHCLVLIRYYPIAAENGRIERVGAIVTDITVLKQAEAELQEQARLLDMAGHIGRFGGWAVDLPGERVEWSDVVAKIHGMPPGYSPTVEEGVGFYAPEYRERIRECFAACTEDGIPFDEELQIVTANGERRWVRSVGAPVRDEGNRIVRIEGAFQDITERKLAERETEQLNQRLTTILESITDAFIAIDRQWNFNYVNTEAEHLTGRTADKLLGRNLWDEYPDIADMQMGQAYRRAMKEQVTVAVEEYYPPLDKWFDIRAYPSEEGLAIFFRDVTENKQAESELREQARLLDMAGRAARFGGWSADLVTGRIVLSQVAAEIRGLPEGREQPIEEGLALYTPEWRDFIWQKFQACATDGIPYDEEAEIDVDGKRAWVRVVGEPVYDDDDAGRVIRVEGAFQDITDRKMSERETQRLTERLRTTLESITDAFFTLNRDWRFSYINAEAERVLERDRDALLDQVVWEAFPDVAGTRIMHEYRRAMDEGVAVALEEYYPPLAKWFDIRVYPSEEGLAVFFRDVTEQRKMVERLREHEQELEASRDQLGHLLDTRQALINSLPAHIALLDGEGTIIDVNEQWRRFGRENEYADPDSGLGLNYLQICRDAGGDCAEEAAAAAEGLAAVLAGERDVVSLEYPCHSPDRYRWFRMMANRLASDTDSSNSSGAVVMHIDVTERKRAEQELERIASEDPVTGALNRNGFVMAFRRQVESAGWHAGDMIVMLDINGQRDINNAHGYEAGDRLLALIARRLGERAGRTGIVGRTGGDEFAVFMPSVRHRKAEQKRHAVATVFDKPFRLDDLEIECNARFGYTLLGRRRREPDNLLREAEMALFEARALGPGEWAAYSDDIERTTQERIRMTHELREALEKGEFELHFQPKVALPEGRVIGAEALLRWFHPERGLVSPAEFIPVAEQSQLMGPIGDWVLFEACRRLREWQHAGLNLVRVAVNVSVVQFRRGRLVDKVREAIAAHGIEPAGLTLEITESVFERESELLWEQLSELHRIGVRLSLDDFGTGYSSLLYLQKYPFDEIKIDQGFVQRILDDPYSRKIVTTVLGIAGALNAEAVAEGIETPEVRDALLELGCHVGQGYYYSVPLAVEDFRWLLEKKSLLPLAAAPQQRQGG